MAAEERARREEADASFCPVSTPPGGLVRPSPDASSDLAGAIREIARAVREAAGGLTRLMVPGVTLQLGLSLLPKLNY